MTCARFVELVDVIRDVCRIINRQHILERERDGRGSGHAGPIREILTLKRVMAGLDVHKRTQLNAQAATILNRKSLAADLSYEEWKT